MPTKGRLFLTAAALSAAFASPATLASAQAPSRQPTAAAPAAAPAAAAKGEGAAADTAEAKATTTGNKPVYPRINLAPDYVVDAAWPEKPRDFLWAAMPGIAVDARDNVWIFTRSQPPIQAYSSEGKFLRAWGEKTIGLAHQIKIDPDGNIWLADIGLHVVRKFSPSGEILMTIGTPGEFGEDETHLDKPTDMAFAPNGHVFVSDGYGNNRVVHFDQHGKFVKAWGKLGVGPDELSLPHAIAIDSKGRLYVADRNNVRIQVYDQEGKLLDSWANVIVPWGFCMTAKDELWVCGSTPMPWREDPAYPGAPLSCPPKDQVVMKFDTHGRVHQLWTIPKGVDGQEKPGDVNWLHSVAIDSKGNLYLGDIIGKRAQKFVPK
ncbi:MAG: peptidyl-alpha-hydroxyglycine alpha-amidating lyase family protein [Aureliella sp.]